jgi:DNA-binding GntR family transcriptional regulator
MSVFDEADAGRLAERTSAVAARLIRAAILDGRLKPGAPLRENDLGKQLGISRTPVREALVILQGEGLIEMAANRGAVVRRYDAGDLGEMYSVRAVLEGYAAQNAAENITADELRRLEDSCDRYRRLAERDEQLPQLVEENQTFHSLVIDASRSPLLTSMIRQTTALPLIYKSYMTYSIDNRHTAEADHRAILEALVERDGDRARHLLESHVLWARDLAIAHLPSLGTEQPASA